MKRALVAILFGGLFLATPVLAQEGTGGVVGGEKKDGGGVVGKDGKGGAVGGQEGGTVLDTKKAHEMIQKQAEAKGGDGKEETQLYDEMVDAGVPPAQAMESVKQVVGDEVDAGKLREYVKKQKKAGLKGKELGAAIAKEAKTRGEAKKKEKAAAGKKGAMKKGGASKGEKGKEGEAHKEKGKKGEKGDDDDDSGDEDGDGGKKKKRGNR